MANIINNTDLDKVAQTVANGKKDKQSLRKPVKLQGEWNLDPSKGFQFRIELSYEKGKEVIEIDSPSFLGGNGNRLGPMAYCVAGITSCFIATFTSVAATQGVKMLTFSAFEAPSKYATRTDNLKANSPLILNNASNAVIQSITLSSVLNEESVWLFFTHYISLLFVDLFDFLQ